MSLYLNKESYVKMGQFMLHLKNVNVYATDGLFCENKKMYVCFC